MNFVKDKKKNALTTENLFYRMVLMIHSPPVHKFNYEAAFELWKSMHNRAVTF